MLRCETLAIFREYETLRIVTPLRRGEIQRPRRSHALNIAVNDSGSAN